MECAADRTTRIMADSPGQMVSGQKGAVLLEPRFALENTREAAPTPLAHARLARR
jgi:hypothetical protein